MEKHPPKTNLWTDVLTTEQRAEIARNPLAAYPNLEGRLTVLRGALTALLPHDASLRAELESFDAFRIEQRRALEKRYRKLAHELRTRFEIEGPVPHPMALAPGKIHTLVTSARVSSHAPNPALTPREDDEGVRPERWFDINRWAPSDLRRIDISVADLGLAALGRGLDGSFPQCPRGLLPASTPIYLRQYDSDDGAYYVQVYYHPLTGVVSLAYADPRARDGEFLVRNYTLDAIHRGEDPEPLSSVVPSITNLSVRCDVRTLWWLLSGPFNHITHNGQRVGTARVLPLLYFSALHWSREGVTLYHCGPSDDQQALRDAIRCLPPIIEHRLVAYRGHHLRVCRL